jgi:Mg-chelatase subunit ChlD
MSSERKSGPALGLSFDAELLEAQPARLDWHEPIGGRRKPVSWTGWGASALLHLAALLVVSIFLLPIDLGESTRLLVEASLEPEERPLETFTMAADLGEGEHADDERAALPTLVAAPVPTVSLPAASRGGGSADDNLNNGWRDASAGKRGGTSGRSGSRAEYFGTVADGDRFVYVLDVSGSMRRGRFDRARNELLRSISYLTEDQWFYVVLFSHVTYPMFDESSLVPRMVRATTENKQRLKTWLYKVKVGGDTDPRDALHIALTLRASAVFLLSDGEFNGHKKNNRSSIFTGNPTVTEVVERNNSGQTPIHTFAYEDPVSKERMLGLADQTGGVYRFIPANKKSRPPPAAKPANTPSKRARANALLQMAKVLEANGKKKEAAERYQRIVTRFPDTYAADEAGRLMQKAAVE